MKTSAIARLFAVLGTVGALNPTAADTPPPTIRSAHVGAQAAQASLLSAACAGARQVAVGDHGVVLLSDDGGRQWRQAAEVPVDVMLTSVSFVDAKRGWAVGHRGVVLATEDGGENWRLQRSRPTEDRPLFAVHFFDAANGVAVGLWSQVLRTSDGGHTWQERTAGLKDDQLKDLNLYHLFPDDEGRIYATAERGQVLRSTDRGLSWEALDAQFAGSLWSGIALPHGRLLVGGLRGALRLSEDAGRTWTPVPSMIEDSITAIATVSGDVVAVGSNGSLIRSTDGGRSFRGTRRNDRLPLTSIASCRGQRMFTVLSVNGPLPPGP